MNASFRIVFGEDEPPAERARRYGEDVSRVFEGLQVTAGMGFAPATLAVTPCGAGRVGTMSGGAHRIERKAVGRDSSSGFVNLVFETRGEAGYSQDGRRGTLSVGDLLVIDGARSFELELGNEYSQMLVQLPRDLVARRHAWFLARAGERIPCAGRGEQFVFDTVAALASRVEQLTPEQRAYALDAVIGLLGVLGVEAHDSVAARRFARALADIAAQLSDPDLSADAIASMQGVSRRRLEAIFAERGTTIGAVIWDLRLERIAGTFADRTQDARRLIDVALSWGFNSEAHFSRSFRRKFGESPRRYRRRLAAHRAP